ncbi:MULTISPECIES: right-handed parallel beta-helix repeat-containing protein [unclassified Streptomyces]|uniref:alpha-1,3-galactosidase-related protein n=1 Tax=unclassified Streptomyces TaxID=2593676 RepID=UPI002E181F93|nr:MULTISPECIES: right-handed parallel beta-helix repeat-containing protein [unclassified Streptomyces]
MARSRFVLFLGVALALLIGGGSPVSAAPPSTPRPVVVDVDDYGADPTGRTDSAPAVAAALRHAKTLDRPTRIQFSRGTYQLYPERAEKRELYVSNTLGADQRYRDKRIGLLVEDMHDVTVDGGGAKLVYHGLQTAFASIRSTDVTFQNFSFDYAAPEVIDATVSTAGVTDGHAYRVLKIPAGSPYRVDGTHITWLGEKSPATGKPYWSGTDGLQYTQIHDPEAQRTWRGDNPLFNDVASVTDLGGRRIRIDYSTAARPSDTGLVYQMRLIERTEPGAFIWQSKDVTMRSMNAYYLQSFGVVGQFSENISIDKVNFAPDPRSGRSTASFADFVQMSGVKGKVAITRSVFDGPHDDPVNIHGTYLQVVGKPEPNTLTLAYEHPQTAGFPQFAPGDEAEFATKTTMSPLKGAHAKVTSVNGPSGMDHDKPLTTMTVTFDRPVPDGVKTDETVVENITATPSVDISGNEFRNVPTRGILVTTRKPVRITGNRFDAMSMASIYVSADAYQWYESGPVADLTIRGNSFTRPTGPVIFVEPTNQVVDPAHPVHRNISVEDNAFDIGDVTVVDAKSVGGFAFTGNTVRRLAGADQPPYKSPLFVFHGSSDIRIAGNHYDKGLNTSVVSD